MTANEVVVPEKPAPFTNEVDELDDIITSISEIPSVVKGTSLLVIRLAKEINGVDREVVMLGEVHSATKKETKAAEKIIPFFENFGCEGIDIRGFIEGKIFFWFMDNLFALVVFVFSFGMRGKNNKSSLNQATEYSNDIKAKKRVIFLEKNWKPSFRFRFFLIAFPVCFVWSMFSFGKASVGIGNEYGWWWALIFIGAMVFHSLILMYAPGIKHIPNFIIGLILDYVFDLGQSRNRNMTKNLMVTLEENSSINNILIITGKDHTKSMTKILKKKYGFSEIAFE